MTKGLQKIVHGKIKQIIHYGYEGNRPTRTFVKIETPEEN